MPNDAMWDQGVLYYASGNEMFRKNAMMQCGAREVLYSTSGNEMFRKYAK